MANGRIEGILEIAEIIRNKGNHMEINNYKAGLILGSFLGLWHVAWSVLVASNLAEALLNWILWLHMMNVSIHIEAFDLMRSVLLVLVTSFVGFIGGFVLATLWNFIHRQ